MNVFHLESRDSALLYLRPRARNSQSAMPAAWLECATELTTSELHKASETNRFRDVLFQAIWGAAISVGMVVLLIAFLDILNVR